jgi:Holliday junction resolvase RusA-like endonuclease
MRNMLIEAGSKHSRKAKKLWDEQVIHTAKSQIREQGWKMIDEPCALRLIFLMPRPKSRKKDIWFATYPDEDKAFRAIKDSLTVAGLWLDDSRVAMFDPSPMLYKLEDESPGVWIRVRTLRTEKRPEVPSQSDEN